MTARTTYLTAAQVEAITDLIDEFGFIAAWVEDGKVYNDAKVYAIVLDRDAQAERIDRGFGDARLVTLAFEDIDAALVKIAEGSIYLPEPFVNAARVYCDNAYDADLDAEIADCAIQIAVFGDVIFG